MANATKSSIKPIMLYDHLPGILAGYPAIIFLLFSLLSLPLWKRDVPLTGEGAIPLEEGVATVDRLAITGAESIQRYVGLIDPHMLFWIGLSIMILWYIAFAFNLPKSRFLMVFGLLGTFIGIPVVLEIISEHFRPFSLLGSVLGSFTPEMNTGGWFVMALTFFGIWLGSFIYSRTHLRVKIDEDGLTLNQLGGKGERFELVGLKTENEPIDYLELFLGGVGSLALKTRMNKPIFKMNRVIGLYRTPWFPFIPSKLSRIEAILNSSNSGGNYQDRLDAAEMSDAEGTDDEIGEETYEQDKKGPGHSSTQDKPGEIS